MCLCRSILRFSREVCCVFCASMFQCLALVIFSRCFRLAIMPRKLARPPLLVFFCARAGRHHHWRRHRALACGQPRVLQSVGLFHRNTHRRCHHIHTLPSHTIITLSRGPGVCPLITLDNMHGHISTSCCDPLVSLCAHLN